MPNKPNFKKIFGVRKADDRQLDVNALSDEDLDRLQDTLDDTEDGYDDSGNAVDRQGRQKHEVERIAELLVQANPALTKQQALHHLLHDRRGAALIARMRKQRRNKPMTWETLQKFVKNNDGYMLDFCKSIADIGNKMDLTEAQFTKLATVAAKRDYPNDPPDKAFAKFFEANEVVRRAYAVVKGMAIILPVYAADDQSVDDPADALAQLQELAAEQHRRQPETSLDKCFAKVYSDPANARLAQAERRQSRARMG